MPLIEQNRKSQIKEKTMKIKLENEKDISV
jgi:hypothetical protein